MRKDNWLLFVGLFSFAMFMLGFQNCTGFQASYPLSIVPQTADVLRWDNAFAAYPSNQKPEFMAELDVMNIRAIDADTSALTIDGVIIKVDQPAAAVTYEARWYGANGDEICSAVNGATSSTRTTFRYECLSTVSITPQTRLVGRIYALSPTGEKLLVREIERN
jgi:hypothetical protein